MSNDNVHILNGKTKLPIEVKRVIDDVVKDTDKFETVLFLAFDKEGNLDARSSRSDVGELLYLMHLFQQRVLSGEYGRCDHDE